MQTVIFEVPAQYQLRDALATMHYMNACIIWPLDKTSLHVWNNNKFLQTTNKILGDKNEPMQCERKAVVYLSSYLSYHNFKVCCKQYEQRAAWNVRTTVFALEDFVDILWTLGYPNYALAALCTIMVYQLTRHFLGSTCSILKKLHVLYYVYSFTT